MAKIEFRGWVEKHDNERAPWTIVENHSVKDDTGKWVTKSKTFHKVWLPKGVDFLPEGELVTVAGTQKTQPGREYQGRKVYDVVVYADTVEDRNTGASAQSNSTFQAPAGWSEVDADSPF